jgi:hypothetical protein
MPKQPYVDAGTLRKAWPIFNELIDVHGTREAAEVVVLLLLSLPDVATSEAASAFADLSPAARELLMKLRESPACCSAGSWEQAEGRVWRRPTGRLAGLLWYAKVRMSKLRRFVRTVTKAAETELCRQVCSKCGGSGFTGLGPVHNPNYYRYEASCDNCGGLGEETGQNVVNLGRARAAAGAMSKTLFPAWYRSRDLADMRRRLRRSR